MTTDKTPQTSPPSTMQVQTKDPSMPAATTFQEDLTLAGQRRVNLIWEYTQAIVAVIIVVANVIVAGYSGIHVGDRIPFPEVLSNALFLVIGFYFSRTNHTAVGGMGPKPQEKYTGR